MKLLTEYLTKVKADDALKNSTDAYIRRALGDKADQNADITYISDFKRKDSRMKKLITAMAATAACALLAIGGYTYYNTPVQYVSLDINPSIELGVNAFERVVSAEACNDDGQLLLKENDFKHLRLEDAVDAVVQEAAEQGYILEDGSTVIAATAVSNNEKAAETLKSICEAGINQGLSNGNASGIVYTDCVDLQLRTQAQEAGMSAGKYRLIEVLQTLSDDATVEQYRNSRITDIITSVNTMMQNGAGAGNGNNTGALEQIQQAANQVQAAYANMTQDQNQNQNQNTDNGSQQQGAQQGTQQGADNAEQEQNQNVETSGTEQEQEQNQNQVQPSYNPTETGSGNQNGTSTGQSGANAPATGSGSSSGSGGQSSGGQGQ